MAHPIIQNHRFSTRLEAVSLRPPPAHREIRVGCAGTAGVRREQSAIVNGKERDGGVRTVPDNHRLIESDNAHQLASRAAVEVETQPDTLPRLGQIAVRVIGAMAQCLEAQSSRSPLLGEPMNAPTELPAESLTWQLTCAKLLMPWQKVELPGISPPGATSR